MGELLTTEKLLAQIEMLNRKLERVIPGSRFITRPEIIDEIGRVLYEKGVERKKLTPIKGKGSNSKVRIERMQYENYL